MPQDTIPSVVPRIGNTARYQAYAPQVDTRPMDRYFNYMQKEGLHTFELIQAVGEKYEQNEAKAAFNKFDVELNRFTQENFYSKQNKDLVDAYQPTLNSLYDIAKKYADGLSGTARDTFINSANERMRQAANNMNTQYMRGLVAWGNEESQARIANLSNDALADVDDWRNPNSAFAVSHQAIRNELTENLISNGVPPDTEAFHTQYLGTLSQFHCGSIDTFINSDRPKDGFAYLNANKKEMTQADINKYTDRLNRLQEAMNQRYLAQLNAQRIKEQSAKGLSFDQQWQLAVQRAGEEYQKIENSNLDEDAKRQRRLEVDRQLANTASQLNQAKELSKLNDNTEKNVNLEYYRNEIISYLSTPDPENPQVMQTAQSIDDIFTKPSDMGTIQRLGLYEDLNNFLHDKGVKIPKAADYELFNNMKTHPEDYSNWSSAEFNWETRNFTAEMQKEATKAIENAAQGKVTDLLDQQITEALDNWGITDPAEQGQMRAMIREKAGEILRMKDTKVRTQREINAAVSDAILYYNSFKQMDGFSQSLGVGNLIWNEGNPLILQNMIYTGKGRNLATQELYNISIPPLWLYSPEGQQARREAYRRAAEEGRANDREYINSLLNAAYNQSVSNRKNDAENKAKLGLNK